MSMKAGRADARSSRTGMSNPNQSVGSSTPERSASRPAVATTRHTPASPSSPGRSGSLCPPGMRHPNSAGFVRLEPS